MARLRRTSSLPTASTLQRRTAVSATVAAKSTALTRSRRTRSDASAPPAVATPAAADTVIESGLSSAASQVPLTPPKGKRTAFRDYELSLHQRHGHRVIVGVDEAGRGCLAGPVCAAAVYVPLDEPLIEGVYDSKALSERERERLYTELTSNARIVTSTAMVDVDVIAQVNILQATLQAMSECVTSLQRSLQTIAANASSANTGIDYVLIDGNHTPKQYVSDVQLEAVVGGDSQCYSIAAASIIAKVTRDRYMRRLESNKSLHHYGLHSNVGYGTLQHREAIAKHGYVHGVHRLTFSPMKEMIQLETEQAAGSSADSAASSSSPALRRSRRNLVADLPTSTCAVEASEQLLGPAPAAVSV